MTALLIASVCCLVWVYLLGAGGGFWRAAQRDDARPTTGAENVPWPSVVAVIPARNEATVIGGTIGSLLRQDYRGRLAIIVVDDHSTDGTAAAARHAAAAGSAAPPGARLAAPALSPGGAGKPGGGRHRVSPSPTLPRTPRLPPVLAAGI